MLILIGSLVPFAAIGLIALWEYLRPCRPLLTPRWQRWPHNLAFIVIKKLFFRFVLPISIAGAALASQHYQIGMLHVLQAPVIVGWVATFLILDFCSYVIHYALHYVPWMWRLHRVHHSDTDLDVTTATRSHPFDDVIYFFVHMGVAAAVGMPPEAVLVFQFYAGLVSKFSHGNITLPEGIEKFMHRFMVTPAMHRAHHSALPKETNSNFSIVLPWWDGLFGTYCAMPEGGHQGMIIGLETFREPEEQKLHRLLLHPLFPNRPVPKDWRATVQRQVSSRNPR
ncbi:MAG: sterol desaturase family protein [Alphaproteobacteria bacterium]